MKDNYEITSKNDDRSGLRHKPSPLSLEQITRSSRALDDIDIIKYKKGLQGGIGEQALSRLLNALDLAHKVKYGTDSIEKLEKMQEGQVQSIKGMAKRLGREDIFVAKDFGEGSFAFRLDDGNVQLAKDLKQLSDYLNEKKAFEISEGELDRQLQKGETVKNGKKVIKIELLAADMAQQHLQNEVDYLEQRKNTLAAAYWSSAFKGEQIYAYKNFEVSNGERVETGLTYSNNPDTIRLNSIAKGGSTLQLESAKLYDAVNYLERASKQRIKEFYKALTGIEITLDEVYAHKFKEKLYITGSSELKTEDLENSRTQGLDIPQAHIDALKSVDTLEEEHKPKRIELETALEELKIDKKKQKTRETVEGLIRKDVNLNMDLSMGSFIPYKVNDGRSQLAKDREDMANRFNIPADKETRDQFYADKDAESCAEFEQQKVGQDCEYENKAEVRDKVERIGLKRTEDELKKSQENDRKYIARALNRHEIEEGCKFYHISGKVRQADGTYKQYDTIKLCDDPKSMELYIDRKYFKLKDTEYNTLNTRMGETTIYRGKDDKSDIKVKEVDAYFARGILDNRKKNHVIAELQEKLGRNDNDISGGEDVSTWKGPIYSYKIHTTDTNGKVNSFLQIAESPEKMVNRLVRFGIIDSQDTVQISDNIVQISNKKKSMGETSYGFTSGNLNTVVEKAKFSDVEKELKNQIEKEKRAILRGLASYYEPNFQNNARIVHAGNKDFANWDTIDFVEIAGKVRFGKDRESIQKDFPGEITKKDITYVEALKEVNKLKRDRNAYMHLITMLENGFNDKIESHLKNLGWDVKDLRSNSQYEFQFRKAKAHYDFTYGEKRYIGASLKEAAKYLGVDRKQIKKLENLTEIGEDGYFIGSSSKVRRRNIDSNTLEAVENNRDNWKMPRIYVFQNDSGQIVFSDNEEFNETEKGKSMNMNKQPQVIDINHANTKDMIDLEGDSDPDDNSGENGRSASTLKTETDTYIPSQEVDFQYNLETKDFIK